MYRMKINKKNQTNLTVGLLQPTIQIQKKLDIRDKERKFLK